MELIAQYEKQIQHAQLESTKRRLQIAHAQQEIDKCKNKNYVGDSSSFNLASNSQSADYYAQERAKRDLSYADREIVRAVLLRELGGESYVPPAMEEEDPNGGGGNQRGNDRVIIRTGDKAVPEISFHCTSNYRFSELLSDACDFYGVPQDDFELVDSNGIKWMGHLSITSQYSQQLRNNLQPIMYMVWREQLDVGRIYNWRHPKPTYKTEQDLALEGAQAQADQRNKSSATSQVPAGIQRVIRQMGSTLLIVVLMSVAMVLRRNVQSMFFMTQSVRTKVVQQQFGQYMEKSFQSGLKDVKDVYEWMEGPMVDAFSTDIVDGDQQNIIARSFRQIGAVRLRQVRVKRDATCVLSSEFPQWESERSKDDADSPLVTFSDSCIGNYFELDGFDYAIETARYGPAMPNDPRDVTLADMEGFVYNSPTNISNIQYISTYRNAPEGELNSWWVFGDYALYGPGGYIVEFAPGTKSHVARRRIQGTCV